MARKPHVWLLFLGLAAPFAASAGLKVEIGGLEKDVFENVRLRLSIVEASRLDAPDEALVRRLHARARDEIRDALQPFGYYEPQIDAALDGAGTEWLARYVIDPGPPTRIESVDCRITGPGAADPELAARRASVPLVVGERLRHQNYALAKDQLQRPAYERGYIDAAFTTQALRVDIGRRAAQVELVLETGPRYRFGPIVLEQDLLDEDFLRRYLPLVEGEPFEPQKLLDTEFLLGDLGYFSRVEVLPQREQTQGDAIPILIRAAPRAKRRYSIGVGYGTDTGARATAGLELRRLNRRGHQLDFDLRVSEIKSLIGGEYRIPFGRKPGENLGFNAGYSDEKLEDGDATKHEIGTSLTRLLGDWQRRLYLQYEHEEFLLGGAPSQTDLLMPGLAMNRSEADDPINARRGWYAFGDLHGGVRGVVSDTSFVQFRTVLRGVLPLGARSRLLGRYEFGGSVVEEFRELPPSQRFFAGGDQSVRGYRYRSLGPTDAAGRVIGGRFLTSASIELETLVWREWGAAIFFDIGGADDDPNPDLYKGAGIGLRWRAPVGTLQADVAHPLDDPEGGVRLHLGIRVGL